MTKNTGNPTGRPPGERELTSHERAQWFVKGFSVDELATIFRMDPRTVMKRIVDVESSGRRGKAELFAIHEVAPHLVKPVGDFAEYIKTANPRDLPPLLTKEYWNGLRARQAAMLNEGELWRTDRVLELLSRTFKSLRTKLLLMPDELERKTTLSEAQRSEIKSQIDDALEKMRDDLLGEFGGEPTPDEKPGTITRETLDHGGGDNADAAAGLDDEEPVELVDDDPFDGL